MNKKTPLYYSIMETIKDSIINGVYPINLKKSLMLVKLQ